jgi:hypothetical protein
MNEQTSNHPESAPAEGRIPSVSANTPGEPTVPAVDRVPGDPPVPITVWRTAASPHDPPAGLPERLAYRLVAAYSRPGETVLDLTDGHVLAEPCSRGGRYHQCGWFTDASSLIVGPPVPPIPQPPREPPRDAPASPSAGHPAGDEPIDAGRDRAERDPAEVAAWFGEDLLDDLPPRPAPDIPPPGSRQQRRRAGRPGGADDPPPVGLAVAQWPRDEPESTSRVRLAWLMSGCARLLRRGGCLVLVTAADSSMPDLGVLVSAGDRAGFGYLQHIVAVYADTDGDQFVYYATDTDLHALTGLHALSDTAGHSVPVAHIRVHADLVVLVNRQDGDTRDGDTGA